MKSFVLDDTHESVESQYKKQKKATKQTHNFQVISSKKNSNKTLSEQAAEYVSCAYADDQLLHAVNLNTKQHKYDERSNKMLEVFEFVAFFERRGACYVQIRQYIDENHKCRMRVVKNEIITPSLHHVPAQLVEDEQSTKYVVFRNLHDNSETAVAVDSLDKFFKSHLITAKHMSKIAALLSQTVDFQNPVRRDDLRAGWTSDNEFVYKALLDTDFTVFAERRDYANEDEYYNALTQLYTRKVVANIVIAAEVLSTIYHLFERLEAARPIIHMFEPAGGFGKTSIARAIVRAMHGTTTAVREAASDTQVSILRAAAAARDSLLVIDEFQNFTASSEKRKELVMQLASGSRTKAASGEKLKINTFRNATLLISNTPAQQLLRGTATHVALSRILEIDVSALAFLDSYIDDAELHALLKALDENASLFKRDLVEFVRRRKDSIISVFSEQKEQLSALVDTDNKRVASNAAMFATAAVLAHKFLCEKTKTEVSTQLSEAVVNATVSAVRQQQYTLQQALDDLQRVLDACASYTYIVGYYNPGGTLKDMQYAAAAQHNAQLKDKYVQVKFVEQTEQDEAHTAADAEHIAISSRLASRVRDLAQVDVDKLFAFLQRHSYACKKRVKSVSQAYVFDTRAIAQALSKSESEQAL